MTDKNKGTTDRGMGIQRKLVYGRWYMAGTGIGIGTGNKEDGIWKMAGRRRTEGIEEDGI